MLIATFAALFHWRLEADFVILWLIAAAVIAFTCNSLLRVWQRIVAGLIAPLVPLTYAVGQVVGWIALLFPAPAMSSEVILLNERGERVA
jgi:uncharacterized protein YqhQ